MRGRSPQSSLLTNRLFFRTLHFQAWYHDALCFVNAYMRPHWVFNSWLPEFPSKKNTFFHLEYNHLGFRPPSDPVSNSNASQLQSIHAGWWLTKNLIGTLLWSRWRTTPNFMLIRSKRYNSFLLEIIVALQVLFADYFCGIISIALTFQRNFEHFTGSPFSNRLEKRVEFCKWGKHYLTGKLLLEFSCILLQNKPFEFKRTLQSNSS